MKKTHAAWLAGFLEGEGSFMVRKEHAHGCYLTYSATISVTNTNRDLLERCQIICGGGDIATITNRNPAKWKQAYIWHLRGPRIVTVLRSIGPFLGSKKEQAALLLELRSMTRSGARPGQWGFKFTEAEREKRRQIHECVKRLNHRGSD